MSYRKYEYESMKLLSETVFQKYGYSPEDAETITDVLLKADLMGIESHGVNRMILYTYGISIGRIKVDAKPEIVHETPISAVFDGHACMGQIVSSQAMKLAVKKAKEHGIGFTTVRNSNHYGIAGYYSLMAAEEGLVGMSMTNTQALVVRPLGVCRFLARIPLHFPSRQSPIPSIWICLQAW